MAKGKKISDFENALLSNTKIIKNTNSLSSDGGAIENESLKIDGLIEDDLFEKYQNLAIEEGIELSELIRLALEHFLNMKDVFFSK